MLAHGYPSNLSSSCTRNEWTFVNRKFSFESSTRRKNLITDFSFYRYSLFNILVQQLKMGVHSQGMDIQDTFPILDINCRRNLNMPKVHNVSLKTFLIYPLAQWKMRECQYMGKINILHSFVIRYSVESLRPTVQYS